MCGRITFLGSGAFAVAVFALDQAAKAVLFSRGGVCNDMSALGIVPIGTLSVLEFGIVAGLLFVAGWQMFRAANGPEACAWAAIVAGGVSNAADRIIFGCIRDVFPFFGVFLWNIADGAIVIGAAVLLWRICKRD